MEVDGVTIAYYLCMAVGGFFIFGGLAVDDTGYMSLGGFNLVVAYFLRKRRQYAEEENN